MPKDLKEETQKQEAYSPAENTEEYKIQQYLKKRIPILKSTKKDILNGLNFEEIMKEADEEYQPKLLKKGRTAGVMLIQDEITGLRGASRVVPIGPGAENEWRSDVSEPTLMVKIQTALSILVDRNPEAVFKAMSKKYKATTPLAYAAWKRSWVKSKGKRTLKLFIQDLARYGWAIGRTYPRLIKREGEIVELVDADNPENNKYKKVSITEYNDIFREKLDPHRTWIDDATNLSDPWSMDDWYYEKDFSKGDFKRDFGQYSNESLVTFGALDSGTNDEVEGNEETKKRDDMVTVGFYESKNKDLYGIWIPNQDIVLYSSPLPNDQKKLSCWWTYWLERDPRTPYGLGLYEIIKNDKVLFDRFSNMTVDQLTMAIYPMLFYSGSNKLTGQGDMVISPGVVKQKLPGTTIEQTNINYDPRGIEAIDLMQKRIDEITGITPTLIGEIQGKTLGETLHAKDAALRRLNTPLGNVAEALEDEAYIALSWMNQVYSIPEVMEFATRQEMEDFEKETGKVAQNIQEREDGKVTSDFYQTIELSLAQDKEGNLVESSEDQFFTLGKDIEHGSLNWEGVVHIEPLSILAPSKEIERQMKLELFNLVQPIIGTAVQLIQQLMVKEACDITRPVRQILEISGEKFENWLPKEVVEYEKDPEGYQKMLDAQKQAMMMQQNNASPLFVDPNQPKPSEQSNPVAGRDSVTNPVRESMNQMKSLNK